MTNDDNKIDLSSIQNKNINQDNDFIKLPEKKTKNNKKDENLNKNSNENLNKTNDLQSAVQDDLIYKNQLINKINQYKRIFYEFLTNVNCDDIQNNTVAELEETLLYIKNIVQNRNIESNVSLFINVIPYSIEKIGGYLDYNLDGYTSVVAGNREYYYTMQQILLEMNAFENVSIDPKYKLLYILASSAFIVHQTNVQKKLEMKNKLDQNIENLDKYKDL